MKFHCSDGSNSLVRVTQKSPFLNHAIKNPTQAAAALDEDERAMFNIGPRVEANFITESGLYALVLRSRKPTARKFAKWVTTEVLPEIRRTGAYAVPASTTTVDPGLRWLMFIDTAGQPQTKMLAKHLVILDPTDPSAIGDLVNEHIPIDLLTATAAAAHHRIVCACHYPNLT